MKKLPVIIALGLFSSLVFNSCKKEYTCTCTANNPIFDTTITVVTQIDKTKEKHAKEQCDVAQETSQKLAIFLLSTVTCKLDEE